MRKIARQIFIIAIVFTAAATLAAKCEDGEDLTVSVNVTNDNLCAEIAEVRCHNIFLCCTGNEIENEFGVKITTSEGECRRDMKLECEKTNAELLYALEIGTVSLSTTDAQSCLNSMIAPNDTCFPYSSNPSYIDTCSGELISGHQAGGQACLFDFECVTDAYCAADRKCMAYPTLGQSCASASICATGLYCGTNPTTYERECMKQLGTGQGCDWGSQCGTDLYCKENELGGDADADVDSDIDGDVDGDADGDADWHMGECTAKKEIGDSCDGNQICKSGKCLPGMCDDGLRTCFSDEDCTGECEETGLECASNDDCRGTCEGSAYNTCDEHADCQGTCELSFDSCFESDDCPGECAATGAYCTSDYQCESITVGDTCEHETCEPGVCDFELCVGMGKCNGTPSCAETYGIDNYCLLDPSDVVGTGGGGDYPGGDGDGDGDADW
ncbi:MAG: hypothetical protein GY854_09290 [Deltaproteobacteria bacterium]|nr:hypothetical protein [Deltaproteobacteria bacterium]